MRMNDLIIGGAVAFIVCGSASEHAFGADESRYAVRDIPPGLRGDADAVIREDRAVFEVRDRRRARFTGTRAVTIFKPEGRSFGVLTRWYDRFRKVRSLEGWIYDEQGRLVRDLEDSDVRDNSAISRSSLYEDSREKTAEMYYDRYPYTVLYTYEEEYDGVLNWPDWTAQEGREGVQWTSFEVRIPADADLRYWTNRDSVRPVVTVNEGTKIFCWSAKNLPCIGPDLIDEDVDQRTTIVMIAPGEFQVDEYPGRMSSWKDFGAWDASLYFGRDRLPEQASLEVRGLLRPGEPPREVIGKLYRYMQSRTRYVSVQLGIGGWQPFDAAFVHEKGYGDCKALANYMVSLLKEAGVTAYPVLIYSGGRNSRYRADFPSNQFNHAIVCVPLGRDSVWLECTSQFMPPGHLGWSTEDRFALMLTPAGGELVRTPASKPDQNIQHRTGIVTLAAGGGAQAAITVRYTGDQCDGIREELVMIPAGEREKWLLDHMQVQNASLTWSRIQGLDERDSSVSVSAVIAIPRYGSVTGTRCFFQPNMMERRTRVPREMPARRSPVRFSYPYRDIDSIVYRIPAAHVCEALPKEQHLESPIGSFHSKTILRDDSTIVFTRVLEIRGTEFPADRYADYRKFFADIVVADRAQAVLVRKKT